jgi:hypothetical protein
MGLTTDRNDPGLREIKPDGQQEAYLVLSEEERRKGFVRPVRYRYKHLKCGGVTTMGAALSETYAARPKFYGGTMCVHCGTHFHLQRFNPATDKAEWQFEWLPEGDPVGSNAEEAEAYLAEKRQREAAKHLGSGI